LEFTQNFYYKGFITPHYIAEGSYLIPNEQMFEDITVSQKLDALLEVRSSYSFIYKHKDVMEIFIIGCKKNLAYENIFPVIELFRYNTPRFLNSIF